MANNQKFTLTFDAQLNVNQMKGALNSIQSELSKLKLPANISKGLQDTFEKLSSEVKNFENISSGGINSKNDLSKLEASANRILTLYERLQSQAKGLGNLSGSQLEKLFPESVVKNIEAARTALKNYSDAAKEAAKELEKANSKVTELNNKISAEQNKKIVSTQDYKQMGKDIEALNLEIETLTQKQIEALEKVEVKRASLKDPDNRPGKILPGLEEELKKIQVQLDETKRKRDELRAQQSVTTTESNQSRKLDELNAKLTDAQQKATAAAEALRQIESIEPGGGVQQLIQVVGQLTGLDMSKFSNDVNGVAQALQTYLSNALNDTTGNLRNFNQVVEQNHGPAQQLKQDTDDCVVSNERFQQSLQEVDAVKKRIQYFFGLSNAINLVKRAIRGAFDTIKELDKAMTATAVVTDFSVSDMWAQLPEYTKRANELGVTTLAAYEAATLYYQQGLKTNEVNALSVETLKMARIAGLDAAEATDRMTNALRGFNMALTEANAQRVDDVYSELAANTASNVDEISTAMTKVASLANNANMEFETTAAFLAQIIETTRESAETAGTALKTVVARFSEVKKLVDEGTLRGQDEEGQAIDVNKVGAALRTAGIDLNKYFLGEVGLDDIFMELASKWDSLTSLQQRYIATQAAGSRQQSRFIALMSDYARTQELVGKAYNANGAAARQFAKTQESLESKLARLKNAWNEFLMGLTNNQMVKGFVDLLTDLLNAINKITSAFGEGTNSILKWGVAIGGILGARSLLSSGGLVDKGLMALLSGTGIGNALNKAGILSNATTGATGEVAKGGIFGSITGGVGKLGKGLWSGAKKLGTRATFLPGVVGKATGSMASGLEGLGLEAGTAASLTGVATALGAVAAAAGVAYTAYQLWLKLSPKGQLKQAELYASAMDKVAESTKKTAEETRNALEKTQEFNTALNNASTPQERKDIIQDQNEYISSLLEQDATYAKYLRSTFKNGQLILTLDENALAEAANKAAEAAVKAAAGARFAQAAISAKQAQVYESELRSRGIDLTTGRRIVEGYDVTSDADIALWTQYSTKIAEAQATAFNEAQSAYAGLIDTSKISDETAELMSSALAEGFDNVDLPSTTFSWLRSRSYWQSEYLKAYGTEADSNLKTLDIARAVKQQQQTITRQGQVDELTEKLTGAEREQYKLLLWGLSGEIDLTQEELGKLASQAAELDKILEKTTGTTAQNLRRQQEERQTIRQNRRANIYEQALRSGMQLPQLIDLQSQINNLDFEQLGQISDIITNAAGDISQQTFEGLFSKLPSLADEELGQIQDFFGDFDLNDPIDALQKLRKAQEEAADGSYFKELLADIEATNPAITDAGNLIQNFFTSSAYDELSDSISDFIEENGRITEDNIEELALSCDELETILDNTTVTAEGLAEAFNLFEQAKLPIDAITTSLLEALSAGESFDSLLNHMESWVKDFDAGESITKGSEHIVSQVEEAMKYVENWQFGDEPIQNIYDHLFGEGKYDDYMKEHWGEPLDQIEAYFTSQLEHINHLAKNQGLGALQELANQVNGLNITSTDGLNFKWDLTQFNNTKEAIAAVTDQLGVTEGAAESLIASWGSHFWDLRQDWDELNLKGELTSLAENIGESGVVTEATLSALGASLGLSADEVKIRLQEVIDKLNETRQAGEDPVEMPIIVNWQDENEQNLTGDELINQFKNTFIETPSFTPQLPFDFSGVQGEGMEASAKTLADQYKEFLEGAFTESGNIDFNLGLDKLLETGLSESQATEVLDSMAKTLGAKLEQTVFKPKVEIDETTGEEIISTISEAVTAVDASGLKANVEAELEAANYELVASKLAGISFSDVGNNLQTTVYNGVYSGAESGFAAFVATATATSISVPITFTGGITTAGASGGIVGSYASGSEHFHVQPGTALTGEEDPEIVWNKEKGYAYITGQNGPEFQNLQPGDRVFNAAETKKILKNSSLAKGGSVVSSYASGGYKPPSSSGSSGGGSGSGKDEKENEWKNDLDWLYNLMEDIAELERDQKAIEEQYEDYLKDQSKNGKDLYNLLIKQLGNLYTQLDHQTFALEKREQEMREFMDVTNDQDKYLWYNWEDRTLEIDWDKIDKIRDEELYKHVKDLIDEAEDIQSKIDDADDAIMDITNQIQELENIWRDTFVDFEKRVLDAIIKSYQKVIDNYSELNDTLNNSNSQILDSLQKQISLQRQIRDNTKTEEEISNDEARLAYLRRDTSGGNDLAALQLEKELADQRENYEDTLIDQAISRLQEDNDIAAQQREQQIEIMQAQLDYQSENGMFNAYVSELLTTAMGADGELLTNSDLVSLLKEQENWGAMSDVSQAIWEEELNGTFKEVAAFLLKENAEITGAYYAALTTAVNGVTTAIGSYSQAMVKLGDSIKNRGSSGGNGGGSYNDGYDNGKGAQSNNIDQGITDVVKQSIEDTLKKTSNTVTTAVKNATASLGIHFTGKFATGGLADTTGLAWLDGTPSEPEYVLNARQTEAFLKLSEVLPQMMNSNTTNSQLTTFGNNYINVAVSLESVSPDYDVDRMVDILKDKLYDSGTYRNINSLSFIR